MLMPCETIMKEFLPAVRAGVAKDLSSNHGFTQINIASKLGITQASVSKYLTGDYTDKIKSLEDNSEIKKIVSNISSSIVSNQMGKKQMVETVCMLCEQFFDEEWNCKIGEMVLAKSEQHVRA